MQARLLDAAVGVAGSGPQGLLIIRIVRRRTYIVREHSQRASDTPARPEEGIVTIRV